MRRGLGAVGFAKELGEKADRTRFVDELQVVAVFCNLKYGRWKSFEKGFQFPLYFLVAMNHQGHKVQGKGTVNGFLEEFADDYIQLFMVGFGCFNYSF